MHGDAEVIVGPGATGFVRALIDDVLSPFDCHGDGLGDPPVFESERCVSFCIGPSQLGL